MRAIILLVVAGCAARGTGIELPEAPPISLASTTPALEPGEHTRWQVFWRNIAVGRVELTIDEHRVHTTFRTGILASALSPIRYELLTEVERGRVTAAVESLTVDGKTIHSDVTIDGAGWTPRDGTLQRVPGGTQLHTLHSALGVVRAWSLTAGPTGYLWVLHQNRLFRLDVFRPSREEALGIRALRVDGVVRALDGAPPMNLTLWLAANRDRTPIRFVVEGGGNRVSAEVIDSTASFAVR